MVIQYVCQATSGGLYTYGSWQTLIHCNIYLLSYWREFLHTRTRVVVNLHAKIFVITVTVVPIELFLRVNQMSMLQMILLQKASVQANWSLFMCSVIFVTFTCSAAESDTAITFITFLRTTDFPCTIDSASCMKMFKTMYCALLSI